MANAPLIPPHVEGAPVAAAEGGGYCYVGPHPADARVTPGQTWDPTEGRHVRPYPPVDLRLFSFRDGCYYFVGDPVDWGYRGTTYPYYGAHPLLDHHGGGWCFMIGAHAHWWRPWSPFFTVVGPWYYWHGPYDDPFFWSYWPYYSFYYRSHYPRYYAGGRYFRGSGYERAPGIGRVPRPESGSWRATPASPTADARWRSLAPGATSAQTDALTGGGGWRARPSAPSSYGAGTQRYESGREGWGGGSWRSGGGFRSAPVSPSGGGSWRAAPSGGGWRGGGMPSGGGRPSGGGGGSWRGRPR